MSAIFSALRVTRSVAINRLVMRTATGFIPAVLTALAVMWCGLAGATPFVFTMQEQGSDIVVNGSGEFDLTGLSYFDLFSGNVGYITGLTGAVTAGASPLVDGWLGASGPRIIGPGDSTPAAAVNSGDLVGIVGDPYHLGTMPGLIYVPHDYVSGTLLTASSTWLNWDFMTLGVTPGVYVWTWGDAPDQSITLKIVGDSGGGGGTDPVPVPEPSILGLTTAGLALLAILYRRRRQS